MEIITRKEAKAAGLQRYFTGKPCKHGHVSGRLTSGGNCQECLDRRYWGDIERPQKHPVPAHLRQYLMARKEAKAAGLTTYFTGQPCREGHVAAHWTSSANCVICERASFDLAFCCNKKAPIRRTEEYRAEHQRKWRAANAEKERARVREYQIENKERYMEYQTAYQAARRVLQRKAQPPWVDVAGLRAIYRDMRRKNRKAGKIVCHVDHIVPLKGRNVCGLHVPWNLRVISARENMQKGNRFET
jgi:hypothetical protein